MKKRTEITIETERMIVVRGRSECESQARWCDECVGRTRHVALNDIAAFLGIFPLTVLRWAEAASLHLSRDADGSLFVCLSSRGHDLLHTTIEMTSKDGSSFHAQDSTPCSTHNPGRATAHF